MLAAEMLQAAISDANVQHNLHVKLTDRSVVLQEVAINCKQWSMTTAQAVLREVCEGCCDL
jgi:hypothetical protein